MTTTGYESAPSALDREPKNATVILVHGIWMQGPLMQLLAWHLRSYGYQTRCVSYRFLSQSPAENSEILATALETVTTPTVHFVAHSLGGIVWLHYINSHTTKPGRTVLLGSPVQGSNIAQRLHRNRILNMCSGTQH